MTAEVQFTPNSTAAQRSTLPGTVGWSDRRSCADSKLTASQHRREDVGRARPEEPRRGLRLLRRSQAALRRAGRSEGRRDPGQQHLSGRLPQRQPADPGQRPRRGAREADVERLLFLGSSCIYPKFAEQPIREDSLLTGHLEPTNDAYAIAKIAGILQVQAVRRQYGLPWISAMPTNLYGPNDNFSPTGSHVLPALIRRYDEAVASGARSVTNWGTGTPRREFLHADDMADACLHLLEHYDGPEQVNVGTGTDVTIREIAETIAAVVGYTGETAVGHREARRHAAEAARRLQARRSRLDVEDQPAGGIAAHRRLVPRPRRCAARVAAQAADPIDLRGVRRIDRL